MWYIFLKKNSLTQFFFYSTLKSFFWGFHQSQLQAILPKKGSHFEKKNEKIIKNKLYAIFFGYLNDTGK